MAIAAAAPQARSFAILIMVVPILKLADVRRLLDDHLGADLNPLIEIDDLFVRQPDLISGAGWHAIDQAERRRGNASGRPRAKFTDPAEMVEIARSP